MSGTVIPDEEKTLVANVGSVETSSVRDVAVPDAWVFPVPFRSCVHITALVEVISPAEMALNGSIACAKLGLLATVRIIRIEPVTVILQGHFTKDEYL